MKAVQPVPHGKFEWPRWHPERHHALLHVLGAHRASVVLAGLAVIVAVAVVGASAALAPARPTASTAAAQQAPMFAAFRADAVGNAMSLTALRKVFDAAELAAIASARTEAASLAASRQDEAALDRQLRGQTTAATLEAAALGASRQDERALDLQLRGQTTAVTSPVTLDAAALFAAKADERSLDRHVQAVKSGAGTVTPVPMRFSGKPLPF